jgi:TRAP-type C4-dicarboxylate transport system permease small subunit
MHFSFREDLARFREVLKFHYMWRGFFFDRFYAGILRVSEKINWFSARALVVYVLASGALIIINGVARIAAGCMMLWAEELSSWLLIGVCFIGSGVAIKKGLHVGITVIIELAPSFVKRPLIFAGNFLITVFLASLIGISFISAFEAAGARGEALKIPLVIPYMQIPLSGVLILLQMLPFLAGPLLLKDISPEKFLLTRISAEGGYRD